MSTVGNLKEASFFFRQWMNSPKVVGSIMPSSAALARTVAENVDINCGKTVVELGPGTGVISSAMLEQGLPPESLLMLELDPELCSFLGKKFPRSRVFNADASDLEYILQKENETSIATVVSSLPLLNFDALIRSDIIEQCLAVLSPGGSLLQYSYFPFPPLWAKRQNLSPELVAFVANNIPPASVWCFKPDSSHQSPTLN